MPASKLLTSQIDSDGGLGTRSVAASPSSCPRREAMSNVGVQAAFDEALHPLLPAFVSERNAYMLFDTCVRVSLLLAACISSEEC